jgi:hypothetical protein
MKIFHCNRIASIALIALMSSCSNKGENGFKVSESGDAELVEKAKTILPNILQTCPGLEKYGADFSPATIHEGAVDGYRGGIEIVFTVSASPRFLPTPLDIRSANNTCNISIDQNMEKAYISKSACHSLCTGKWQENDPTLMGKEYYLKVNRNALTPTINAKRNREMFSSSNLEKKIKLVNRQKTTSGDGKRKITWDLPGFDIGGIECIGNDQNNADVIAWNAQDFDANGNAVKMHENSRSYALFCQILSVYFENHEAIAESVKSELEVNPGNTIIRVIDEISIESDGLYFFLRRKI